VKYAKGVADYAGLRASEGLPVFLEAFIFYSLLIFLKPRVNGWGYKAFLNENDLKN